MNGEQPGARVLDGGCGENAVLGGKGASLDRLIAAELPVPPTGAVVAEAYRHFVDDHRLRSLTDRIRGDEVVDGADVDATFVSVPFDDRLARSIVDVARRVGDGRSLAVRSSATVEDLAESSFAGQYRSLLDVDPTDEAALLDAVRLVFASLWHPAPCAYRRAFGIDDADAAMAVVLMQMVPASRAGVVFTVDPGGRPGAARVEAVEGLGESLVSGQRTPDAWVIDRHEPGADLPPEAMEAIRLALAVEELAGTPQDVEWAWADQQLWLVQARPITVAADDEGDGFDSHPGDHDLTTEGIGEMLPGVLPPLRWELDSHLVDEAFRQVLDDLGVLPADVDQTHLVRRVRGRAALDFSRLRAMAEALPGNAAEQLEEQYFGSRRPGRPAAPGGPRGSRRASVRHDYRVLRARRRNALAGEIAIEAVADLTRQTAELSQRDDRRILAYRLGLIDLALRAMGAELSVAADATAAYRRIELLLLPHIGESEAGHQAEAVTSGRGITATPDVDASAAVFAGPTWRELDRAPVHAVTAETDDGDRALVALEQRLASTESWGASTLRSAIRTRALRQTVGEAVTQLRRREHLKAAVLRLGGEVRRVHLELGRRLVESGTLASEDEIELLTTSEIIEALRGRAPGAGAIGRRRRWRARYEQEPALPGRFRGVPERQPVELPAGGRLDGWAASSGRVTGIGQVVLGAQGPLTPGRVLVAQATDASWSPLFVDAAAIVLERGGPLSHAAILARELGVPAVLNVAGATQHLDGRWLTVDGDAGVVVVHDVEEEAATPP